MKILFVKLDIKPKSLNHKMIPIRVGKSLRLAKSPECRAYERELDDAFKKYAFELAEFGVNHNETTHAIECVWRIYIPETAYFTKRGTISKTCVDATNTIKMLEDRMVKFLGIDDSQIIETIVRKIPTSKSTWNVCLEISRVMKPPVVRLSD